MPLPHPDEADASSVPPHEGEGGVQRFLENRQRLIDGHAYDPDSQRDARGVGLVGALDGQPRREVGGPAIRALENVRAQGGAQSVVASRASAYTDTGLLRSHNEVFSEEQKKYLAASTQQALAWCQKVSIVLGNAGQSLSGKAGSKGSDAVNLVKRWFADPGTSGPDLAGYIATLSTGFKAMIAMLNKGHFVLTDWVPLRPASTQDEMNFLMSEAFTFPSRGEGMDTVYIERSFFTNDAGGVVHGQKNWTRVVLHELTHLVCGTEDVNIAADQDAIIVTSAGSAKPALATNPPSPTSTTSRSARLSACRPGTSSGFERIFPSSLPHATMEPANVTTPTNTPT